jgi:hypothetical protein
VTTPYFRIIEHGKTSPSSCHLPAGLCEQVADVGRRDGALAC